jgi:lipoate---protein ligase
VGALPGGGLLSEGAGGVEPSWFDVEPYRTVTARRVTVREVDRPLLVLGSTQDPAVVDPARARRAGVTVVRRRSGGGAVYLSPGAQLWVDVWLPRGDPLWVAEPRRAAAQVGEWWADALSRSVTEQLAVHRGASLAAPGSDVVCFAGIGPGEVLVGSRKVVGLAQWRSREGALVHGCAYRHWAPQSLVDLLFLDGPARAALDSSLSGAAVGLDELGTGPIHFGLDALVSVLPDDRPWDVVPI